jgi:hypothetical protein
MEVEKREERRILKYVSIKMEHAFAYVCEISALFIIILVKINYFLVLHSWQEIQSPSLG